MEKKQKSAVKIQREKEELMGKISQLTVLSKIVKPSEIDFLRTDNEIAKCLDSITTKLLKRVNDTVELVSNKKRVFGDVEDINESFDSRVGDLIDGLFERADLIMDSMKETKISKPKMDYVDQSRKKGSEKPQERFLDSVDNTSTPWVPIIKNKPNAKKPLDNLEELSMEMQTHIKSTLTSTLQM